MITMLMLLAAASVGPGPNCKNPMTQTDMNICAGSQARAADRDMAREYNRATIRMRRMGKAYADALLTSQRAWLKFRDAECVVEGYAARGGSMESMLRSSCFEDVTQARTKQLRDLVKSYND